MLYPWPRVRKSVLFIIYSVPKTYSFIYFIKHPKQGEKFDRNKSTFIATKHVQNIIILKQNFINIFLNSFKTFSFFSWLLSISFTHALKVFKHKLVSTDVWKFIETLYWKSLLFLYLVSSNWKKLFYLSLWKEAIFKPEHFYCQVNK